jgi:hypothetical protein
MRVTQPGTRPSSSQGIARNGLPENHWHWLDQRDADDAREAEVAERLAAIRKQARARKGGASHERH